MALFRKDTRDLIMQWVQWALPTSIPLLPLHQTPAHFLQSFVDNRIQSFQHGVDRRAAAQQADPRCDVPSAGGGGKGGGGGSWTSACGSTGLPVVHMSHDLGSAWANLVEELSHCVCSHSQD